LTASKTRFGLKAIGKDVKPASDELYLHLSPQIQQLHQMALYFTVEHQAQKPNSAVAKLAVERNSRLRIFENHRKERPIEWDRSVNLSSKDLPPELTDLIKRAFMCYDDLLDGRHEDDEHKIWRARNEERILRREIANEMAKGTVPHSVHLILDVTERMACATKKRGWKEVFEEYVNEKAPPSSPGSPPRGGA